MYVSLAPEYNPPGSQRQIDTGKDRDMIPGVSQC